MSFKNFRLQLLLRALGLLLNSFGLAWAWYFTEFYLTPISFAVLLVAQFIALVYYCESTFAELSNFFGAFEDRDYTRKFSMRKKGKAFAELSDQYNRIMAQFKELAVEKEQHYLYLHRVFELVNVALISFTSQGKISLINQAACDLLNRPVLPHINTLAQTDPLLYEHMRTIGPREQRLIKVRIQGRLRSISIAAQHFKLGRERYTLVSLQDIQSELDATEMQAWQKLIRVLTHEIMNSVTPLVSLTTAVKMMVEAEPGKALPPSALDEEAMTDIYRSLAAIENRNKGLLTFINAYRDYTKVPEPHFESVELSAFLKNIEVLMASELAKAGVELSVQNNVPQNQAWFDPKLMEQVLINLLKNAIEAFKHTDKPKIRLQLSGKPLQIIVTDNGQGIPREQLDQIFVPFYTTKQGGNGIGLSLSRQIMKAHNGNLRVHSSAGQGSTFILEFSAQASLLTEAPSFAERRD